MVMVCLIQVVDFEMCTIVELQMVRSGIGSNDRYVSEIKKKNEIFDRTGRGPEDNFISDKEVRGSWFMLYKI